VLADHVQAARGVDVDVGQPEHALDRALHDPYALGPRERGDDQFAHDPAVAGVHHLAVEADREQAVA